MVKSNGACLSFRPSHLLSGVKVRTTPGLERQNLPCEQNKIRDKNATYWIPKTKTKEKWGNNRFYCLVSS